MGRRGSRLWGSGGGISICRWRDDFFFVLMAVGDVVAYEEMKVREGRGVSEKVSAKHWVWRI